MELIRGEKLSDVLHPRAAPAETRARSGHRDRGGPRTRAREGPDPSRSETRQRRWSRKTATRRSSTSGSPSSSSPPRPMRPRVGAQGPHSDARARHRHRGVHVARTGARRPRRPSHRHLLARRRALRDAHGAVRRSRARARSTRCMRSSRSRCRRCRRQPGFPATTTSELQRVIAKCTAKDADERYQGMKDIVVDLRAARRRLDSGSGRSRRRRCRQRRRQPCTVVTPGDGCRCWSARRWPVVALSAGTWWWMGRQTPPAGQSIGPSGDCRSLLRQQHG